MALRKLKMLRVGYLMKQEFAEVVNEGHLLQNRLKGLKQDGKEILDGMVGWC